MIAQDGRLWARHGLDPVHGALDGVYLEWEGGLFTRVERAPAPPADLPAHDCFDRHLLTPGLLNAHIHLDYSYLAEALPGGQGFTPWLRAINAHYRSSMADGRSAEPEIEPYPAILSAIEEQKRDGVTRLWDVSTFGWAMEPLEASGLRGIVFREFLAPLGRAWEEAWARWQASDDERRAHGGENAPSSLCHGISPHSAYAVCPPALSAAGAWAGRARVPLAIHLAESPDENDLLIRGEGPLCAFLSELGGGDRREELGVGPTAIARAHAAGLLGPFTAAIHCNAPEGEDARLLAESGAAVVFCPGSHRFFGYPPYPLEAYRRAGVRLALGTDSLASNESLCMRREARFLAELAPQWNPLEILACATGASLGANAPLGGEGSLSPGGPADWALWESPQLPAAPDPAALVAFWLDPATRCVRSSVWNP
jgi:cytosine/adenosine deaminase-related metal-dependent hydrolase